MVWNNGINGMVTDTPKVGCEWPIHDMSALQEMVSDLPLGASAARIVALVIGHMDLSLRGHPGLGVAPMTAWSSTTSHFLDLT